MAGERLEVKVFDQLFEALGITPEEDGDLSPQTKLTIITEAILKLRASLADYKHDHDLFLKDLDLLLSVDTSGEDVEEGYPHLREQTILETVHDMVSGQDAVVADTLRTTLQELGTSIWDLPVDTFTRLRHRLVAQDLGDINYNHSLFPVNE